MTDEIYIKYTMKQIKELNNKVWKNKLKIPKLHHEGTFYIYEQLECNLQTFERSHIVLPSSLKLTDEIIQIYNLLI